MAGLGTSPVGSTPFGFGTPATATAPPEDPPDLAQFIEPREKQNTLASDGEYQRMPIVRHKVLLALTTTLGSSAAVPTLGMKLERKMDDSFEQRQEQNVRDALAHIPANEMTLNSVVVRRVAPTGRSEITVGYDDLLTGRQNQFVTV
jgi:hypothetical protein